MAPDSAEPPPPTDGMARYYQDLERANLAPLWESLAALSPFEPSPRAVPFAWRYGQVRDHLMEAGRLITAEKAERRVVVLANPGLPGRLSVTDTLYAGLQLILPGEIAAAHRHSQSALRFVMEGTGAYTAVDGERAVMHPGDFIITPAGSWHDHGGGKEPVIWMDGLDVPLVSFLHAEFRENGPEGEPSRPVRALSPVGTTGPAFSYPYERSRAVLETIKLSGDIDPHTGFTLRYADPVTGGWAMPTIGATLRLLPKGFGALPYKSTDGAVATVVEGRVRATVGGESFTLGPRDVLALPGWLPYRLEALEETVMFCFSDRPVHEALGLFREWRGGDSA